MIFLKLLLIINMRLGSAKDKVNNETVVLGGLALISVMEDF